MNKMIINRLYIFSIPDRKAKIVDFTNGINIITSSKIDGAKRGKSALLKSIYHALGADCNYEGIWDAKNKTYVIDITINDDNYLIYRYDRLFKIFSSALILLFKTINRQELSDFLSGLFSFQIKLPNKTDDKLENTPPAFSYLLNYVDQDRMQGTYFNSFNGLSQYSNYKENVLYGHFGVFNDEYYELIKDIEKLSDKQKKFNDTMSLLVKMIDKVNQDIGSDGYPSNMEALQNELDKNRAEYSEIAQKLSSTKNMLMDLRNEEYEIHKNIEELQDILNLSNKDIKKLAKHICPVCSSQIEDVLDIKINTYNDIDDILLLRSSLEVSRMQIQERIQSKEQHYKETLALLDSYNKKIANNSKVIGSVLRHKGFVEVKDKLSYEWKTTKDELDVVEVNLKEKNARKREYDDVKKKINDKYYELMLQDKQKFGLQEVDSDKLRHIRNVFTAGGSNMPIATIMWYSNLIKVKYIYNYNAIRFPLVLDSPNNTELDDEKRHLLFNYVFSNNDDNTQLIISTLGFDETEYPSYTFNNIIELTNEPYQLLNETDYVAYCDFLVSLSNADSE